LEDQNERAGIYNGTEAQAPSIKVSSLRMRNFYVSIMGGHIILPLCEILRGGGFVHGTRGREQHPDELVIKGGAAAIVYEVVSGMAGITRMPDWGGTTGEALGEGRGSTTNNLSLTEV